MANPLDQFVSITANTNEVRLTARPKLADFVKQNGFQAGIVAYDEAVETCRAQDERIINERLVGKPAIPGAGVMKPFRRDPKAAKSVTPDAKTNLILDPEQNPIVGAGGDVMTGAGG